MGSFLRGILCAGMIVLWSTGAWAEGWLQRGLEVFREQPGVSRADQLSDQDIALGLKEALKVGSENVVNYLGREGGFYLDPRAHISLPDGLQQVQHIMNRAGMGRMLDDLELRMNRAAEDAAPGAGQIFADAASEMTLEDARGIFYGPDDSATRYFQARMSDPLSSEFTPAVRQSLAESGAVQAYQEVMARYNELSFVPEVRADLTQHVVDHAISAIFEYLALEEAAIRNNPAKQTTDILRRVFGR
ncbi:DUF4197 domain-containing protein [Desulfonatronovibrio hydrogenovorans]|uniref:DUF4197 domain-containing protein n=1 Tax=Desulfonatronovibrio hydrogenovorans TaxID=53245 RepID=UPI0004905CC9|nr:DUF4197 domain-containing protein [Desulfonatronovibrio hydrogenovorans]